MTPTTRRERAATIVAHEAARFIAHEADTNPLITVTRAEQATKGTHVLVFVSVFPEERAPAAIAFLARKREAFSDHLKAHTRLRPLPRVDFLLENRSTLEVA